MLKDYQREELILQAERAKENLSGACPLLEDEVALVAYGYILALENKVAELENQLAGLREGE
jgi:hypothetical protein